MTSKEIAEEAFPDWNKDMGKSMSCSYLEERIDALIADTETLTAQRCINVIEQWAGMHGEKAIHHIRSAFGLEKTP